MKTAFLSKTLKILIGSMILLNGVIVSAAVGADFFRTDPDIVGKVVDFDTGKPVSGVVVMAMWSTEVFRLTIEPKTEFYDYYETLSNENGDFKIPGKGLIVFRDISPPKIDIFKTGYGSMYLQDLGTHFKRDSRFKNQVEWVDGKPIIAFRKKSIRQLLRIPFYGMGTAGVPPEKYRLYTAEVRREYKALGVTPPYEIDHRYLRYKKGGVFPSDAMAIKPKKQKPMKARPALKDLE